MITNPYAGNPWAAVGLTPCSAPRFGASAIEHGQHPMMAAPWQAQAAWHPQFGASAIEHAWWDIKDRWNKFRRANFRGPGDSCCQACAEGKACGSPASAPAFGANFPIQPNVQQSMMPLGIGLINATKTILADLLRTLGNFTPSKQARQALIISVGKAVEPMMEKYGQQRVPQWALLQTATPLIRQTIHYYAPAIGHDVQRALMLVPGGAQVALNASVAVQNRAATY